MTKNTEKRTELNNARDHWITIDGKEISRAEKSNTGRAETIPRPMVIRQVDYPSGCDVPMHSHSWGQLLSITEGLIHVEVKGVGHWIVPPHRAVWIPAFIEHDAKSVNSVSMQNVYIEPSLHSHLPDQCQVIAITPLLRELISAIVQLDTLYDEQGPDGRLVQVMLDQLQSIPQQPLHLPLPSHKALLKMANALIDFPADNRSLEEWAAELAFSERTLARHFKKETGMTFGQWRQQARLLAAISRIAEGESIATTAQDLGYNNQSAFIAMFKKALGKTPKKYFDVN